MDNIIITNKNLDFIKKNISEQGKNKIQVIADFDRTLTKAFVNGEKSPSVIAQLREGKFLTPDYPQKAHDLFDKYHPIEISDKVSLKEKIRKMREWWDKHHELLIKCGLNKKVIKEVVKKRELKFREGIDIFLKFLNENDIPLVIISAGHGDIIEEYLKINNLDYKNIQIIANRFIFDAQGNAIGIKEPVIHTFNKHEAEIKNLSIYKELMKRKNIILLGDSIGDLGMVEGFNYKNIIKIVFLNENIKEKLENQKKVYDVLILNDGSFEYVNKLLKDIIN